jgi:hypothetical protein
MAAQQKNSGYGGYPGYQDLNFSIPTAFALLSQ